MLPITAFFIAPLAIQGINILLQASDIFAGLHTRNCTLWMHCGLRPSHSFVNGARGNNKKKLNVVYKCRTTKDLARQNVEDC
jgi:hypothetical protein